MRGLTPIERAILRAVIIDAPNVCSGAPSSLEPYAGTSLEVESRVLRSLAARGLVVMMYCICGEVHADPTALGRLAYSLPEVAQ
jgi:hypothetical protein